MKMSVASDVASLVTATVVSLAAFGGYVQFVLKRSLLPSVEFDVDLTSIHNGSNQLIGELSFVIKNTGTSMLIVTNVQYKGRYRLIDDVEDFRAENPLEPLLRGRIPAAGWSVLLGPRTFVQPGVTQRYRQTIALPARACVLQVLGSFDYRIEVGPVTRVLVSLFARPPKDMDWRRGIKDHTVRRTFTLKGARSGTVASATPRSHSQIGPNPSP